MPETINVNEPKVHQDVLNEIKTLGENTKKIHEELNKSYASLKDTLEKGIEGNREKIAKLQEDIVTRQEVLDKIRTDMTKRMDDLEIAFKRPSGIITIPDQKQTENMVNFFKAALAVKKEPVTIDAVKKITESLDVNAFQAYQKSFQHFLRKDERLIYPDQLKDLSVGNDPDGGYLVTPEMSNRIIERTFEMDPVRQLATVETISTDALEFLVDWGEMNYGWEGETQSPSKTTTADFKKKRIPVHQMYAKPHATQQLLEDASINIEAWIANKVADRFARAEAAAFVTGDGIGKPRGFLTYSSGTTYGTIQQVNMGNANVLTADGFVKIKYALKEYFLNRGAWLMNRTTLMYTMLLKDGTGNYIWKPSLITSDPLSTILGSTVYMSPTMPDVASDTLAVAYGDWKEGYVIVDRLGITIQRDPYTSKPFVEFYTRKRVGGDVVNWDAIKIGKIAA